MNYPAETNPYPHQLYYHVKDDLSKPWLYAATSITKIIHWMFLNLVDLNVIACKFQTKRYKSCNEQICE